MGRKNKPTQGRKKIAIERIAGEEARHVCFSKRRNGVFTKATDLATLCGAEVAVVVNSPAGNPYSFGSPGVNEVADRFLSGSSLPSGSNGLLHGSRMGVIRELNQQYMELSRSMEVSNAKKLVLEARLKAVVRKNPVCKMSDETEKLGLAELKQVKESLKGVKARIEGRISELLLRGGGASSSNIAMAPNPVMMMDQPPEFGAGQPYLPNGHGYGYGHGHGYGFY